jgi:hypothetical protein
MGGVFYEIQVFKVTYIASRLVGEGRFWFSELLNFDVLLLGNRCIFEHGTNQKRYLHTFEKALFVTLFVWQRHEVQTNACSATRYLFCQPLPPHSAGRRLWISKMPRAEGILDL